MVPQDARAVLDCALQDEVESITTDEQLKGLWEVSQARRPRSPRTQPPCPARRGPHGPCGAGQPHECALQRRPIPAHPPARHCAACAQMVGRCLSGSVGTTVPQLYSFLAAAITRYDANAALAGAALGLPTVGRSDVAAALEGAWNVTPAISCFDG